MLLALLALLAAPTTSPSIAPLTDAPKFDALSKGSMGFEFGFPAGGGHFGVGTGSTVGITYLMQDNMALRIDFGLDAVLSSGGGPAQVNIAAQLRLYQLRRGPLNVFLWPGLAFVRTAPGGTGFNALVLAGGCGVEYFFADHFSVGGQLGLGLAFGNIGGPAGSSVEVELSTSTTGLFAAAYF